MTSTQHNTNVIIQDNTISLQISSRFYYNYQCFIYMMYICFSNLDHSLISEYYTRCCINTIWTPDDENRAAQNMYRITIINVLYNVTVHQVGHLPKVIISTYPSPLDVLKYTDISWIQLQSLNYRQSSQYGVSSWKLYVTCIHSWLKTKTSTDPVSWKPKLRLANANIKMRFPKPRLKFQTLKHNKLILRFNPVFKGQN
jgi:hypothetical protein